MTDWPYNAERGICPVCNGEFALDRRGAIRLHRARDTEGRIISGYCRGTDQKPAEAEDA